MGNCVFKGFAQVEDMVRVVTSSGGIMELFAPITAECITNEFPGHAIYRTPGLLSQPLLHNEELHAGRLYYLLPINTSITKRNDITPTSSSMTTPYRMSFDQQRVLKRAETAEVLPRYNSSGVWKVKLVISPDQLAEILAQESRTEALIESVRTVAKCGNGVSSSVANSDQLSVSSSLKGLW
ncbi:putative pyruvate dehydrogenase [Hibiscus syriacus]|uniref:Pyruvate dehydrogenase n=2 Tax=Hibiscus syriacus TaxID=106335 RepID=A0A6A2YQR6_HIBSY|nr:putative pyruvate dehydrogenase [Hibiscus syriacus]